MTNILKDFDPSRDWVLNPPTNAELAYLRERQNDSDSNAPIAVMTADQYQENRQKRLAMAHHNRSQTLSKLDQKIFWRYKALNPIKAAFVDKVLRERLPIINLNPDVKKMAYAFIQNGIPNRSILKLIEAILDEYDL